MITPRQILASVLHLFILLAFFGVGLLFVTLPSLPLARERGIELIEKKPELCIQIGFAFFFITTLLFIGFYALNRGRYLRIKMGKNEAIVETEVIRQTLEECFKIHFPKKISLSDVEIPRGQRLEIGVVLAPLEEEVREELFIQVEKELKILLKERFGYAKPFHLNIKL